MWLVFFAQPNIINDTQKVNESGKVVASCEVGENTCGYKAKKFKVKIVRNAVIIKTFLPFSFLPKVKLTSFLKIDSNSFSRFICGEMFFHIPKGSKTGGINKTHQARERIELLGSNTENKLVIILCLFVCLLYSFYLMSIQHVMTRSK